MVSKISRVSLFFFSLVISTICWAQDISYSQEMELAAKKGDSEAQTQLGFCLWNGLGISEDAEKAVEWYRKASMQNHSAAQYYLGVCYIDGFYKGEELVRDYKEGLSWLRASAKQGDQDAVNVIKNLTSVGYKAWGQLRDFSFNFGGIPEGELNDNIDIIRQEASKDNGVALFWLGLIKENEGDYEGAFNAYLKAKKAFDSENYSFFLNVNETGAVEMYVSDRLGWYYQNGLGTTTDFTKALKAYTDSNWRDAYYPFPEAFLGEVQAAYCARELKQYEKMINLLKTAGVPGWLWAGECYYQGIGVSKDYYKAFEFFSKVVDSEDIVGMPLVECYPDYYADACYRLYQMHSAGLGCEKDDDLAKLYFRTAVKYGSSSALYDDQKNYELTQ